MVWCDFCGPAACCIFTINVVFVFAIYVVNMIMAFFVNSVTLILLNFGLVSLQKKKLALYLSEVKLACNFLDPLSSEVGPIDSLPLVS